MTQRLRLTCRSMARAYLSGAYTMAMLAEHFGVHYQTVSRAVRWFEAQGRATEGD